MKRAKVLVLVDDGGGNIQVDGFTIQHGYDAIFSGGGVEASSYSDSGTAGSITFTNNIIAENTAACDGGGVSAMSQTMDGTAGTVTLVNNIIRGTRSPGFHRGEAGFFCLNSPGSWKKNVNNQVCSSAFLRIK